MPGTTERRTIQVDAYRSPDGRPACAVDLSTGRACPFLRVTGMCGTKDCCAVVLTSGWKGDGLPATLSRDKEGTGYLRPVAGCPVWRS